MTGNMLSDNQHTVLENMHKTFLEALRHREQEILRFLAILAPAMGGFIWLIKYSGTDQRSIVLQTGTVGVLLLLLLGAVYSIALGYNYRYITLQLAKLESLSFDIRRHILLSWPREPKDFKKYILKVIPYCAPPEIIKVFWYAFLAAELGVMLTFWLYLGENISRGQVIFLTICGILCIVISWLFAPIYYGCKLHKVCRKEEDEGEW